MSETQNKRILGVLMDGRSITPMEAMTAFGVTRLAARINDLRKEGYEIETRMISVRNRNFDTVRVAQYYMKPPEQPTLF